MNSLAHRDFTFDLESLLIPISEASPSGDSLRYDPLYDQIREGRREDDPELSRGVWEINMKKSEWPEVARLCIMALSTRTKDLQIAAWLTECWVRMYGLTGLREGLRLMEGLSANFWESIHPLPEEGDFEYRIAPFEWLNEKLPIVIRLLPITNPAGETSRPYGLGDWENACRPKIVDKRRRDEPVEGVTQADFQQSVMLTVTADLDALLAMTTGVADALKLLVATLDSKAARHSPGLGQIESSISSIHSLLKAARSQRPEPLPDAVPDEPGENSEDSSMDDDASASPGGPPGKIRSRAEAYRRLSEAADYLARTEPHSPTPYLVKRAIVWGGMKLEDLLPELVRNNSELSEIYRLLQIGNQQ